MLHSCPTLVSKPLIPHLPILYLLSLPPHHHPLFLAVLLCLLSPLNLSGFFNGMREVFEPGALNYFTFSRPILSTLSASRNPILTHLPLSEFLDFQLWILIALTLGLAFSLVMPHTLAAASSFSSGRAYLFLNFLPPLFLCSIPTLIMQGSTSLLTNLPRSFLNVYTPYLLLPDEWQNRLLFSPPPEISLFGGTSIAFTPSGTQEVFPTLMGRKYATRSSLLTSSPSMTLTHPPFSIAPLAVAALLTSPLLPLLLPFLAPGRCFRTWVLTTYQFFYLSISLRPIAPTSVPLPSIFQKLAGMALPHTLTFTLLLQRNTRFFLFPMLLLSFSVWH